MGRTFFTADCHFGHSNIIDYCNRPFENAAKMDYALMHNLNERVKEDDSLFVLGDWCMGGSGEEYRKLLQCKNVVFINGNHDWHNNLKTKITGCIIHAGSRDIYLTHNPKDTQPEFAVNFCGHIHQHWKTTWMNGSLLINVGVDVWDYKPVELTKLLELIEKELREHKKIEREEGEKPRWIT